MLACGVKQLVCREGHGGGVEDAAGETDERDDEDDFERIDDVVAQLGGGDVEAQDESYSEAKDGGAAEDGVDADEEAYGEAPG